MLARSSMIALSATMTKDTHVCKSCFTCKLTYAALVYLQRQTVWHHCHHAEQWMSNNWRNAVQENLDTNISINYTFSYVLKLILMNLKCMEDELILNPSLGPKKKQTKNAHLLPSGKSGMLWVSVGQGSPLEFMIWFWSWLTGSPGPRPGFWPPDKMASW